MRVGEIGKYRFSGGSSTSMYEVRVLDAEPATFVAVRVTVYVPGSAYWWTGLWAVEVAPSPNDHDHEVGLLVDVSVNWTARGAVPVVGLPVKSATGYGGARTVM